jgi:hypothetical protein
MKVLSHLINKRLSQLDEGNKPVGVILTSKDANKLIEDIVISYKHVCSIC